MQSDNYFNNAGNPNEELLADGRKQGQDYVGYQLSLLASGATGGMRLPENANALVADRLIDFSKLTTVMTKKDEKNSGVIYATPGDYVVDGSMKKGIILAKGKVTTTRSNLNLKSNMVLVGKLLETAKNDDKLKELFYGYTGRGVQNATDFSSCISYENWEKNSY